MAVKSDRRRPENAVQYVHKPEVLQEKSFVYTFSQTLPMAAMFLRSKVMSWCALFTALQNALNAPTERASEDLAPAWMHAFTAFIGVLAAYMEFVFGRRGPKLAKAGAETAAATTGTIIEVAKETLSKFK